MLQLGVERELRAKAEMREKEEKTERIAACAQMAAMSADATHLRVDCAKQLEAQRSALQGQVDAKTVVVADLEKRALHNEEKACGLEGEVEQLRTMLNSADKAANHEAVQQLGKATGELEVLRRRLTSAEAATGLAEGASSMRIQAMEEELKRGESQRRKLHNLVQELRGNVRVFARVRPFLPNDGYDASALPEPVVLPKADGQSLKVVSAKAGEEGKETAFSFDKVPAYVHVYVYRQSFRGATVHGA